MIGSPAALSSSRTVEASSATAMLGEGEGLGDAEGLADFACGVAGLAAPDEPPQAALTAIAPTLTDRETQRSSSKMTPSRDGVSVVTLDGCYALDPGLTCPRGTSPQWA